VRVRDRVGPASIRLGVQTGTTGFGHLASRSGSVIAIVVGLTLNWMGIFDRLDGVLILGVAVTVVETAVVFAR